MSRCLVIFVSDMSDSSIHIEEGIFPVLINNTSANAISRAWKQALEDQVEVRIQLPVIDIQPPENLKREAGYSAYTWIEFENEPQRFNPDSVFAVLSIKANEATLRIYEDEIRDDPDYILTEESVEDILLKEVL